VFLALVLTAWRSRRFAADDALSIEANQKYLEENKLRKGVITRQRLAVPHHPERLWQAACFHRHSEVYYTGTLINHVIFDGTSPGFRLLQAQQRDPAGSRHCS